jgi:NADPH:quinone reductase-like Zn-dependent oxidoreductase
MKAVGVIGSGHMPCLFEVEEPVASRGGVVVEVLAASVNDFDRAVVEGRMVVTAQFDPVLLGRDFVGRVAAVGDGVDYIDVGMFVAGTMEAGRSGTFTEMVEVSAESLAPRRR